MAARTKPEARWRALVREQEASGRSVKDFARARGLSAASLYWWRSELGRRRELPPAKRLELAAVTVVGEAPARRASSGGFELELSNGRRVRVQPGFDADELRRLIAALERSC